MRKIFSGIGAFLQTPIGVIVATNIVWHIILWAASIPFNYFVSIFLFIVDIVVASYLSDRLIYFFSQFFLPIHNSKDWREMPSPVKNFESVTRCPALFMD